MNRRTHEMWTIPTRHHIDFRCWSCSCWCWRAAQKRLTRIRAHASVCVCCECSVHRARMHVQSLGAKWYYISWYSKLILWMSSRAGHMHAIIKHEIIVSMKKARDIVGMQNATHTAHTTTEIIFHRSFPFIKPDTLFRWRIKTQRAQLIIIIFIHFVCQNVFAALRPLPAVFILLENSNQPPRTAD